LPRPVEANQLAKDNGRIDVMITILLVGQNAELAFALSQRGYLLVLGQIAMAGNSRELRTSDKIIDLYLGRSQTFRDGSGKDYAPPPNIC